MSISRSFLYSLSIPSGPPDIHSLYLGWPVPIFALFPIQIQQTTQVQQSIQPTMASLADIQQMMEEMLSRQETRFAQAIENQRQTLLGEVRNMLPSSSNTNPSADPSSQANPNVNQNSSPNNASHTHNSNVASHPVVPKPSETSNPAPVLNTVLDLDPLQDNTPTLTEREKKLMERVEVMEKSLKAIKRHDDLIDVG